MQLTEDEMMLAAAGEAIQCIKSIRHRTGLGLKESKDAYDNYKVTHPFLKLMPHPSERLLFQPTTVVAPQGNDYGCAFCTLEYLTGIHRDQIAREIGHDGSEKIYPDEAVPNCYATLLGDETNYWLYKKGYHPTSLVTREYITHHHQTKGTPFYEKRYYPTQNEIKVILTDKAAELCVQSHRFKDSYHAVAYLAGIILDPRDGCVHRLSEYNIVAVTMTTIDPFRRLQEIYADQPKEEVRV